MTCDFKSGKIILQQPVAREQMGKLLATGKTDLLENFVSNKTRRKFKAFWPTTRRKAKVVFEFEPRAARWRRRRRPEGGGEEERLVNSRAGLTRHGERLWLAVSVVPNARRSGADGLHDGALRVRWPRRRWTARPTRRCWTWLAEALGLRRVTWRWCAGRRRGASGSRSTRRRHL